MGFKGNFSDLALTDVLQVVQMTQKSGVLELGEGPKRASILFRRGNIIDARPSGAGRYLTDELEATGVIPAGSGARVAQEPPAYAGERIGEKLVRLGLVEANQLRRIISKRVEDTLYEALSWPYGDFDFTVAPDDPIAPGSIDLSTQELLMDALRVMDEKGRSGAFPRAAIPKTSPTPAHGSIAPQGGAPVGVAIDGASGASDERERAGRRNADPARIEPTPVLPAAIVERTPSQPIALVAPVVRWTVEKKNGDRLDVDELSALPTWVVIGRVGRDDRITKDGQRWMKLGEVKELQPFFQAVDRAATRAKGDSQPIPVVPTISAPAAPAAAPHRARGGAGGWIALAIGLSAVSALVTWRVTAGHRATVPPQVAAIAGAHDYDDLLRLANDSYSGGRLDAAVAYCKAAVALDPRRPEAFSLLGLIHFDRKEDDAAEQALQLAIAADSKAADPQRYLGLLLERRGDRPGAIAAYERYLALRPDEPAASDVRTRLAALRQ